MSSPMPCSCPTKVCCPCGGGRAESPTRSRSPEGKQQESRCPAEARAGWSHRRAAGEHCVRDAWGLGPGWDSSGL